MWAPHAQKVSVIGSFNDWDGTKHPMQGEENGYWYANVADAHAGDQYRFLLTTPKGEFKRIDPYAREVTSSVGNALVHDVSFDWQGDDFHLAPRNELVIYELHVGTFNDQADVNHPGKFSTVSARLGYLKDLGVNAIEVMPVGEFAGERSWGYNPAQIFSVETVYGGPLAFKRFVKRAHQEGIAVILDVVYNHLGPSDLDLWQFDGWSENNHGGIYFYNDDRANTPWGQTRPDYGRGEVRQYLLDNALMWLEEYHVDGLRFDCTEFIRSVNGSDDQSLPDGWSLLQWINSEIARRHPGRITIAEDLQNNKWLTKDVGAGGAGFESQWDAMFVHPIRQAVITPYDEQRSLAAIRDAICFRYDDDAFDRVIYTESHDEVANGRARVPQNQPARPQRLVRTKTIDVGRGAGLYGPGHPHAVPRAGVPRRWMVLRHRPRRLEGTERVSWHRAALPRPHPFAAEPRRLHTRPLWPTRPGLSSVRATQGSRFPSLGQGGTGRRRGSRRKLPARRAGRLRHRLSGHGPLEAPIQ